MRRHIYSVKSCVVSGPYTLRLEFDDSTFQTIDFLPVLKGRLFGPLRDMSLFDQVRIDAESETIVWPNGADFDPGMLHDWPEHMTEFIAMVQRWQETAPAPDNCAEQTRRVAEGGAIYGSDSVQKLK